MGDGGAERILSTTLHLIPGYRHIVCYLSLPHTMVEQMEAAEIHFLNLTSNFDILSCANRLKKIIKKEKPFVVHAHLLKSTWVTRLATPKHVPLVFTVHNSLSEDAFKVNRLSLWMEKLTYNKRQTLVSVSHSALNDYNQWVGLKGPSHILYNIIDDAFFNTRTHSKEDNGFTKLVAVGHLRRQKNYINLLKAFQFLSGRKVSLDIYGIGEEYEELNTYIQRYNLPVKLKGISKNLPQILGNYDAFIMPSLFEGYGIAPVEAMAAGLPVLLSNLEVFVEITGGYALFFDPMNPESIASSINEFMSMPDKLKIEKSSFCKTKAKEIASKESFVLKLNDIYKSMQTHSSD
jgi:glycosyltransferase involved in cell wall biosynthesis